jgi:fluoride exporter
MNGLLVAVGGGLGAVLRYSVEGAVAPRQRGPFPLSTLIVNLSGSLALGLLAGAAVAGHVSTTWLLFLGTGVVGGFTTFSTFTYETVRLIEDGAWRDATWNLALSGPLAFLFAGIGYLLAR